jgi:hypothetical protein
MVEYRKSKQPQQPLKILMAMWILKKTILQTLMMKKIMTATMKRKMVH